MLRFFDYGFGEFDAGERVGPNQWPHFDLLCVHRGTLELSVAGSDPTVLSEGDALLLYPQTPFRGRCPARCRVSVQHFALPDKRRLRWHADALARLCNRRAGCDRYRFACPGPLEHDIARAIRMSQLPQTAALHELRVAQLVLLLGELWGEAGDAASQAAAAWQPLLEWVNKRLDRQITLAGMAKVAGLSTSRFRARFREHFGVSPGQYVQQERLGNAAQLLRETAMPIKLIAQRVGYSELANFYRAFRKAMRSAPAAYRKRHALEG